MPSKKDSSKRANKARRAAGSNKRSKDAKSKQKELLASKDGSTETETEELSVKLTIKLPGGKIKTDIIVRCFVLFF